MGKKKEIAYLSQDTQRTPPQTQTQRGINETKQGTYLWEGGQHIFNGGRWVRVDLQEMCLPPSAGLGAIQDSRYCAGVTRRFWFVRHAAAHHGSPIYRRKDAIKIYALMSTL